MYQPGDLIVYGSNGVCKVLEVGERAAAVGAPDRLYYTLQPVYSAETIYTPVDTAVFMRPVISREQAEELIEEIPDIDEDICQDRNMTMLSAHYQSVLQSHDCRDLIQLVKSVYAKNQNAVQRGKRLGQVDQRYWKRAEDLLHGELAVALELPREEVTEFIKKRIAAEDEAAVQDEKED